MNVYIYAADLYCEGCGHTIAKGLEHVPPEERDDSNRYPQGPYGDGGGEADSPQHCGGCRAFLCNPLTDDGAEYVRDQATQRGAETVVDARAKGETVLAEWLDFYK